jgi:hypothetical protein
MAASFRANSIKSLPVEVQNAVQIARDASSEAEKKLEPNIVQRLSSSRNEERSAPAWAVNQVRALRDLKEHLYYLQINPEETPELQRRLIKFEKVCQKIQQRFPELFQKDDQARFCPYSSNLIRPLSSDPLLRPSKPHWEINFALLHSAFQKTEDVELKKALCFLIVNYLAKAAFLNGSPAITMSVRHTKKYAEMMQLGEFLWGGLYHRNNIAEVPLLRMLNMGDQVGSDGDVQGFLVDTIELQPLFPISFTPIPRSDDLEAEVETMCNSFDSHLEMNLHNLNALNDAPNLMQFTIDHAPPPFLIDITDEIENSSFTLHDKARTEEYLKRKQQAKQRVDEIILRASDRIQQKYPNNPVIQNWMDRYLMLNTLVVSRAKQPGDNFGVLIHHQSFFNKEDFDPKEPGSDDAWALYLIRSNFIDAKLRSWLSVSAAGIGAVNLRYALGNTIHDPEQLMMQIGGKSVAYSVKQSTVPDLYPTPSKVLDANLFKSMCEIAMGRFLNNPVGAAQRVQAEFTVAMMTTLFESINEESWKSLQDSDPAIQEVTQTVCLRIQQHLSEAVQNIDDFRKFSQAIDRVHSEMATLLFFYAPFNPETFDDHFIDYLRPILPSKMEVRSAGVAKSAMNIFSGVNAAVMAMNPNPVRAYCPHSYYEEQGVLGGHKTLDEVLTDDSIKVDLYVAEFHHNIDIDSEHTHYEKGRVVEDIRKILKSTDQLTVAIDATIDYTRSGDLRELLHELKPEIDAGRLNLVVFRSGQKFDMMGFDNYFGATYFVINNGDPKWDAFQNLKTDAAYQTDPLSCQYFTWMAFTGLGIIDGYKDLIFRNTRAVLNVVPESLLPAPGKKVCVSTFAEDVKTPFIDVKIGEENEELRRWAQMRFFELYIDADKIAYRRGSFGFPHPNFTWISPKIRLNVGIDPTEIVLYEQFFKELEAKVSELELANELF